MSLRLIRWTPLVATTALALAISACGADDTGSDPEPTQGSIAGTVTDANTGAALEGATVTTEPAGESVQTSADGAYTLADLEPGTYVVVVELEGYTTKRREGVTVTAGATVTLDVTMDPAVGEAGLTVTDLCAGEPLAGATVALGDVEEGTTGADGTVAVSALEPGDYTFSITAPGYLPGKAEVSVAAGEENGASIELECQAHAVAERARDFLAGLSEPGAYQPNTSAQALHDNLYDGDASNDPMVISVRGASDYEAGHVPGAVNIPWKSVADDASLATLDAAGEDATFVDYCYTGHTGGIAATVLNLLGYATANMKFGIVSWTTDATARGASGVEPDQSGDFTVETTVNEASQTFDAPWLEFDVADAWEATQAAAQAYLGDPEMRPTISATELWDNLNDGNAENDPFIISVRAPDAYAAGHIPGAINIPWKQIALEESLSKIPTDRDIVVYCYTGHTGAIATGVLGTLGYHKVRNLKFGFMSWTQDATARASAPFDPDVETHDFPVVSGTEPGTP